MATYYVGIGGNDGNNGTSWALRKLTLNGAEDVPVAANDTVYVGPGVYRELLTVDVSGNAGNPITYIADVTGEHTDGVGGIVRITGSDNDQTTARANCITASNKDYRTFRGFSFDTASSDLVSGDNCDAWIIEDCTFQNGAATPLIDCTGGGTDWMIRRCVILHSKNRGIHFHAAAALDNSGHLVENCLIVNCFDDGIQIERTGDMTIRNCLFNGNGADHIDVQAAPNAGHPILVYNCILVSARSAALEATAVADMTENYNTFYANATDRANVNVGANSLTYPPLLLSPILHSGASQVSGFQFPWWFGELSEWSQIAAITGSNEPTEDLLGIARPTTASKNSWGALQFSDAARETGTVHAGSVSLVLNDAGRHQIWVPVANESTTISVYVYREANYAGNNPQLIVKQPGQTDDVTTDAAAASQWNQLTTTLTPAAEPPYVVVELVSRNTNGANDKVFFDDLTVT